MTKIYCENCGSNQLENRGDTYYCPHCRTTWRKHEIDEVYDKLASILDEQKQERVANLRHQLYDALNEENIVSADIIRICNEIRGYLPEDFQAKFFMIASKNGVQSVAKTLRQINPSLHMGYVPQIMDFMLKTLQSGHLAALNDFLDRAYGGGRDGRLFDHYNGRLQEEAQKVEAGVYDPSIPRDVFVAYASADRRKLLELVDALESNGLKCFVAMRNMQHFNGENLYYQNKLEKAMNSCKIIVFVSSVKARTDSDAYRIELPYVKMRDLQAHPEYQNCYERMPSKFKKPRIEYIIEEHQNKAAEQFTKEFFNGFERLYSPEEVVRAVYKLKERVVVPEEAPKQEVKYCAACGTECKLSFKLCPECGSKDFVSTHEEYISAKAKREKNEEIARAKREKDEEIAKVRAEMQSQIDTLRKSKAKQTTGQTRQIHKAYNWSNYVGDYDGYYYDPEDACYYEGAAPEYLVPILAEKKVEFEAARESKNVNALGEKYYYGKGVTKDLTKAVEYFKQAAKKNNAQAQCNLGSCYFNGEGTSKDLIKAVYWFQKSAEQDYAPAQYNLSVCYYNGSGLDKNLEKAVHWMQKAADQEHGGAKKWLPSLKAELEKIPHAPYTINGDSATFGHYPQSKVTDNGLIATLNRLAGSTPSASYAAGWTDYKYYIDSKVQSFMWYKDVNYGGEKYRAVYFNKWRPFWTQSRSSKGNTYQGKNGYKLKTIYWFKWEPIKWKILKKSDGELTLFSDMLLDSLHYYWTEKGTRTINGKTVYPHNYAQSDIRSWLNTDFLGAAFDAQEKNLIKTTFVDNSLSSTGDSSNNYVCENTSDKIYLLSYKEATSASYGFGNNDGRKRKPTDYAQAQGAFTNPVGYWWLRSPDRYYGNYALCVHDSGDVYSLPVSYTDYGVAPALRITI